MSNVWQAPTPGQATLVGHVNQLLATHAALFTYNGAVINTDPTLTDDATQLGVGMLGQQIVISAPVNLGSVLLALGAIGAGQDVLVTLQADSGGQPSGTPLVGCVVPPEWLPASVASEASMYTVPLPYPSLPAGTYWVVLQPGSNLIGLLGDFSQALAGINDVAWTQTEETGGAIYADGSWTDEDYGFGLYLRDSTGTLLTAIADDQVPNVPFQLPAKVTSFNYTAGLLTNAYEWVVRSLNVTTNEICRDDASFEVSIGSATEVENCALARSEDTALDGFWSLKMIATADGTMVAQVGPYPVTAGDIYSWTAAFLSAADAETAVASVSWYDGDSYLSTSDGATVDAVTSEWLASAGTDTAPDTATLAFIEFVVEDAPGSSEFYVDGVGLFAGPSAVWSYPGVGVASLRTINYVDGMMVSATVGAIYTVSFEYEGGTGSPSSETGSSVMLPGAVKDGYTFDGWYTAASEGTLVGVGGDTYTPGSDITLYAQWTAVSAGLPFALGVNESNAYGLLDEVLTALEPIGMQWCRAEVPWNYNKPGGDTETANGFNVVADTYSSTVATAIAAERVTIESYGFEPLFLIDINAGTTLTSTWTSGPPTTPAQYAAACAWLVAQSGLQGCHWELMNEPDGSAQGITAALYVEALEAAYTAMKAADPTCTIHAFALSAVYSEVGEGGSQYYEACYAINSTLYDYYDVADFHTYSNDDDYVTDAPPSFVGPSGVNIYNGIAMMQQIRLEKGDTKPFWLTEIGWPNSVEGIMTPTLQAEYFSDLLTTLSGYDSINDVNYSEYLEALCIFAGDNAGAYWGIMGEPDDASIAIPVLTELVAG